jgi:branched-subunit amino acid aminotransferase/4-amino-4-deoxychorismate lyase
VKNGVIQTAPAVRVLTGITRGMIFDIAHRLNIPMEEADLTVGDGEHADEIFMTSTIICQLHARSFNGTIIHDSEIGPITRRVRQAFIEEIGLDYVQQATQYDQFLRENGPLR